eukprot:COSAG02_NODE_72575_length_183_cov_949.642857_1_plen_54_part_10
MAKSLKAEQLFFVFCLNGDKGQKGGGDLKYWPMVAKMGAQSERALRCRVTTLLG